METFLLEVQLCAVEGDNEALKQRCRHLEERIELLDAQNKRQADIIDEFRRRHDSEKENSRAPARQTGNHSQASGPQQPVSHKTQECFTPIVATFDDHRGKIKLEWTVYMDPAELQSGLPPAPLLQPLQQEPSQTRAFASIYQGAKNNHVDHQVPSTFKEDLVDYEVPSTFAPQSLIPSQVPIPHGRSHPSAPRRAEETPTPHVYKPRPKLHKYKFLQPITSGNDLGLVYNTRSLVKNAGTQDVRRESADHETTTPGSESPSSGEIQRSHKRKAEIVDEVDEPRPNLKKAKQATSGPKRRDARAGTERPKKASSKQRTDDAWTDSARKNHSKRVEVIELD